MGNYRKVLAAIGDREDAGQVWYQARALAAANGSALSLLHVERRLFEPEVPATPLDGESAEAIDGAAHSHLRDLLDSDAAEGVDARVAAGHPWRMILDTAHRSGADCIVIGSHTRWGILGSLGSTTDRVVHGADNDVLVVRIKSKAEPIGHNAYRRILVPVDFCDSCARVVEHAKEWAERDEAELRLLHIEEHFPTDRSNEVITPEDEDPAADAKRRASEQMRQMAAERGIASAVFDFASSAGAAKHEIVAYAGREGVDLIVIGSHGIHGPADLLGSTTDGVLHRAPCDVLLVRVRD